MYIIMKALNGFLMTHRHMTLRDVCGYYIMLENFIGHVPFLADTVDTIWLYSLVVQHLRFCGVQCIARSVNQPS